MLYCGVCIVQKKHVTQTLTLPHACMTDMTSRTVLYVLWTGLAKSLNNSMFCDLCLLRSMMLECDLSPESKKPFLLLPMPSTGLHATIVLYIHSNSIPVHKMQCLGVWQDTYKISKALNETPMAKNETNFQAGFGNASTCVQKLCDSAG